MGEVGREPVPLKSDADRESTPPPPSKTPFPEWDLRDQLVHLRDHLFIIIKEEHPPSAERIEAFFTSQNSLPYGHVEFGDVGPEHRSELYVPEITRWVTGSFTGAEGRPEGSERYGAMNDGARERVSSATLGIVLLKPADC